MWVSQLDIARLSDDQLRRQIAIFQAHADDPATYPGIALLERAMAHALVGALRERLRSVVELDSDVLNVHDAGGIVEAGTDPVAEALEELRRPPYDPFDDGGVG